MKAPLETYQEIDSNYEAGPHFKFGYFYYNPDDPRLYVPRRGSLRASPNFARPMFWLLGIAGAFWLLAMME